MIKLLSMAMMGLCLLVAQAQASTLFSQADRVVDGQVDYAGDFLFDGVSPYVGILLSGDLTADPVFNLEYTVFEYLDEFDALDPDFQSLSVGQPTIMRASGSAYTFSGGVATIELNVLEDLRDLFTDTIRVSLNLGPTSDLFGGPDTRASLSIANVAPPIPTVPLPASGALLLLSLVGLMRVHSFR